MNISKLISAIPPLDQRAMEKAAKRQAQLTKPAGSLGRLEAIAIQVAGITGREIPLLGKKQVILCAADHGVAAEGVSAFPAAVTPMMVLNFLHEGAAINALARQAGAEVKVVDVGVAADLPKHKLLLSAKIAKGTKNFKTESAMSEAECTKALELGVKLANQSQKDKMTFVVLGEMGIGNTTSAAALMAALLPCAVEDVTGFGTGIDRTQWMNKCRVIQESLRLHLLKPEKPLEALQKVGGLEIARPGGRSPRLRQKPDSGGGGRVHHFFRLPRGLSPKPQGEGFCLLLPSFRGARPHEVLRDVGRRTPLGNENALRGRSSGGAHWP